MSFASEEKLWRLRCFVGEPSKNHFHILHAKPQIPNPSINDTQIPVSTVIINDGPRYQYQRQPERGSNDAQIPVSKYHRYPAPSINDTQIRISKYDTQIPVSKYQRYPEPSIQISMTLRVWHCVPNALTPAQTP